MYKLTQGFKVGDFVYDNQMVGLGQIYDIDLQSETPIKVRFAHMTSSYKNNVKFLTPINITQHEVPVYEWEANFLKRTNKKARYVIWK